MLRSSADRREARPRVPRLPLNRATTLGAGVQSFVFPEGCAKCRIWKRTVKRRWSARAPPMACKILASASGYSALQVFTKRLPITLITSMSMVPGTGATKTKIWTRMGQCVEPPRLAYLARNGWSMARFRPLGRRAETAYDAGSKMRYRALGHRVALALRRIVDPADFEFGLPGCAPAPRARVAAWAERSATPKSHVARNGATSPIDHSERVFRS